MSASRDVNHDEFVVASLKTDLDFEAEFFWPLHWKKWSYPAGKFRIRPHFVTPRKRKA